MRDIRDYYRVTGVFSGGAWLGAAVCSLFDGSFFSYLAILFLLAGIIVDIIRIAWIARTKMEDFDEMAQINLTKAKAFALTVLHTCSLPFMVIVLLNATGRVSIHIEADTAVLFAVGIGETATGWKFLSLERNGE